MSLDAVDAAFVRRLAARTRHAVRDPAATCGRPRTATPVPRPVASDGVPADPSPPAPPAPGERPVTAAPVVVRTPVGKPGVGKPGVGKPGFGKPGVGKAGVAEPRVDEPRVDEPIVARLLARAPEEWDALAGHVETARQRGRRVIAVAGGRAGEGRTTLLHCLASRLRSRGRDVACATPLDLAAVACGADGRGPTHDKRIILVDAGIWFPPGPIRRSLLQVASLGCDAAILVRRAGASGGFARQAALEALGIEVLGEVLTFTSPAGADDIQDGDAAA